MTLIDEDVLTKALSEYANTFEVSPEAPRRILAAAQSAEPPKRPHVPAVLRTHHHGRAWLVAAALVVVVAGISVPLFRGEGTAKKIVVGQEAAPPASSNLAPATSGQGLAITANSGAHGSSTSLSTKTLTGTGFAPSASSTSPKIESTGTIALTVKAGGVASAFTKLNRLATGDGGFVDSTRAHVGTHASGTFSSGTITLQVPQREFAKLVAQVQSVGHATSVNTTSSDVTTQFVDLRAHLSALRASRQQYLTIMTKATTIAGILAVQSQLNELQSQIEQLQGQLSELSHSTTYATLTLSVAEAGAHTSTTTPRSGIDKAWHDSVGGFVSGFEWLVRLAGPVVFAALALGVLFALSTYIRRTVRRRRI